MRRTRVIPVLLIHQGGVFKTTGFSNPVYIGDPINAIRLFNDMEVDEIVVLDIDASKNGVDPNIDVINELTSEAFMPFAYGGGIKTLEHVRAILRCGVEKVILNHAIIQDIDFLSQCVDEIGAQSVVASIDYKKKMIGGLRQFDHVTKKMSGRSLIDAALNAEKSGAGEIMLNSVEKDGRMTGLDLQAIYEVSKAVNVPVIACGGAGTLEHLRNAEENGASAIAAGSMFVFKGKQRGVLVNYPKEVQLRKFLS